jgi:hypothetical protein
MVTGATYPQDAEPFLLWLRNFYFVVAVEASLLVLQQPATARYLKPGSSRLK